MFCSGTVSSLLVHEVITNDKIVNEISYVSKNINSLLKNDTKKITSNSKVMNNRIQKLSQTNKDSILKAERKLKYGMSLP